MDNNLTEMERAELVGLRAASAKGKLLPADPGWGRMLELIGIAEGQGRTELVEEWGWQRVEAFYGVKRAFFFEMQALGTERGRRVPWEDPVRLGEWFVAMKAVGARKRGAPAAIMERVRAAQGGLLPAAPVPVVERGVKVVAPPVVEEGLELDFEGEADAAVVLQHIREQVKALQDEVRKRQREGKSTVDLEGRLQALWAQQRQWELSVEKIRKGDEAQEAAMRTRMSGFAGEAWQVIRRAVLEVFGTEERVKVEAALNRATERLPVMLEEHFGYE